MVDFTKLKTDEERLAHAPLCHDVGILAGWEQDATTEENRRQFHSFAIAQYHRDEALTYGEV